MTSSIRWNATPPAPLSLRSGSTLGRYRLVELIGQGGMGEVWKAHDDNLDRDVAIKLLHRGKVAPSLGGERFRREALILSRLAHAGVATVFDFDIHEGHEFLVMEYVDGGSLESLLEEGPLPIDRIITIGIAIADALDHAHRQGIVHRDLKPGNVVLTSDGQPKILDFGLGLLVSDGKAIGRMTQPGMIVGSLAYMSPEQLVGDVDARSDVYAFGVLLFEMATGKKPFRETRVERLMFAIMNRASPAASMLRPEVPEALERLITECLRKDPAQRPASAAVVSETLRGIRDGAPSSELQLPARNSVRAIAVLPLRNLSRDPAQEYFGDALTESLISDLARIKALRVISRTSAMAYKGVALSLPEIARELNVDAVLEGSALLVGNRVRVSVQLVSARTDTAIWAERYDRELEDVLALQGELAQTVAREIAIQVSPAEAIGLENRATVNPGAQLEYMKSRHALFGGSPEAIEMARRHARRALEVDPMFAPAWSALAECDIFRAIRGMAPAATASEEARLAATRALELDPSLPEAYVALGLVLSHTGDLAGGLSALQRAIELNPGLAAAHNLIGRVLYSYERHAEALEATDKSVRLDPMSMMIYTGAGDAYYFARQFEKSVFHYRMSIELDPRFDGAHTGLARSLEALGHFDEARAHYEQGHRLSSGVAGPSFGLAHLEAASGNVSEARRLLAELTAARATRVVSAWGIAVLHASLGEVDDAYHWLDIAYEEKAPGLLVLRAHPRLDPIRSDARYWPLVRKLGLEDPAANAPQVI